MNKGPGIEYHLVYDTRNAGLRFITNTSYYAWLIFCIYISRDSTFWTIITGGMFMVGAFGVLKSQVDRYYFKFSSITDLKEWIDEHS